jgi:(R,R)-butanediol dehydrogenase/meso-butanediol dehydrogenase/diacetyl reductase
LETAVALGATQAANVAGRDTASLLVELTGGEGAHLVVEASGVPGAPAAAVSAARRGGRVVLVGLQSAPRELDLLSMALREVEVVPTVAHVCDVDLPEALAILAARDLATIVVDRTIPLGRLVEDGLRPLAERRLHGKVLVDPAG